MRFFQREFTLNMTNKIKYYKGGLLMLSFSVNLNLENKVFFPTNKKVKLALVGGGNKYQFVNVESEQEVILVSIGESALFIKSSFVENTKPFVYSISNENTNSELFNLCVKTDEKITSYFSTEQQLKIFTDSSYIEFTIQNGGLVLRSDKYLSLDSDRHSLQMMKF